MLASVLSNTLPLGITGILTLAWLAARRARWDWPAIKAIHEAAPARLAILAGRTDVKAPC